eukprot:m.19552 g.19552  ORF g.19552 m.19552 type:complete len:95 (-) comp10924_c0_seq4:320-604(-)
MCRLILELSTQVTKSCMRLVTKKAGSVIVLGPTRTWPCSTIFTACFTLSAILRRIYSSSTVTCNQTTAITALLYHYNRNTPPAKRRCRHTLTKR